LPAAGQDLPDWPPLISADPLSVHKAGISVDKLSVYEKRKEKPKKYFFLLNSAPL